MHTFFVDTVEGGRIYVSMTSDHPYVQACCIVDRAAAEDLVRQLRAKLAMLAVEESLESGPEVEDQP
jgi:hypothetical protein